MTDQPSRTLDCGRTLDELVAYLERGRIPRDPHIESCPECLNALEALERVGHLSRELVTGEAAQLAPPSDAWFGRILSTVQTEVRAGRRMPISHDDPNVHITTTEGAVRALLRAVGDEVPGVFVTTTRLRGDVETPGASVRVELAASVTFGVAIAEATTNLRAAVADALARHTSLQVAGIDITIDDVHVAPVSPPNPTPDEEHA